MLLVKLRTTRWQNYTVWHISKDVKRKERKKNTIDLSRYSVANEIGDMMVSK